MTTKDNHAIVHSLFGIVPRPYPQTRTVALVRPDPIVDGFAGTVRAQQHHGQPRPLPTAFGTDGDLVHVRTHRLRCLPHGTRQGVPDVRYFEAHHGRLLQLRRAVPGEHHRRGRQDHTEIEAEQAHGGVQGRRVAKERIPFGARIRQGRPGRHGEQARIEGSGAERTPPGRNAIVERPAGEKRGAGRGGAQAGTVQRNGKIRDGFGRERVGVHRRTDRHRPRRAGGPAGQGTREHHHGQKNLRRPRPQIRTRILRGHDGPGGQGTRRHHESNRVRAPDRRIHHDHHRQRLCVRLQRQRVLRHEHVQGRRVRLSQAQTRRRHQQGRDGGRRRRLGGRRFRKETPQRFRVVEG